MKILHLMLGCFYIDNYSYQENYLPKYHKLQGNDVEIVASLVSFDENGKSVLLPKAGKYVNEYNIPVTRLNYKNGRLARKLRYYVGLKDELERIKPDLIFIHGVQFMDVSIVAKYCKTHKNVKVFADNHSDFSNSAKNWISKYILHGIFWRSCAQKINPYVTRFYGVLPARVDFLADVYGIPKDKIELLVMGADDEAVKKALNPDMRKHMREKYGISDDEVVVMTGGKIDNNKPQTVLLMETINKIQNSKLKLLVFGTVSEELKSKFEKQLSERVQYIGWKKSEDIYNEFSVADIIAFPGLHSVLWEQAVAMGKPCIFRKIDGFSHIDLGGNCTYFEEQTIENYEKVIKYTYDNIERLKTIAQTKGINFFSYEKIAKKALGE